LSTPNRKRFRREELHQQVTESTGMDTGIELEIDDESVVVVPSPLFLDDDETARIDEIRTSGAGTIELAKTIVGEENHKRLIAAGYSSNDVMLAWLLMQQDMSGVLPDGRPTQPGTSSEIARNK
jgi:hypothetical protein